MNLLKPIKKADACFRAILDCLDHCLHLPWPQDKQSWRIMKAGRLSTPKGGKVFLGRLSCFVAAVLLFFAVLQGCALKKALEPDPGQTFDIDFASDLKDSQWPDPDLESKFVRYWSLRFKGDKQRDLFQMEAPHFQAMAGFERYRVYLRNLPLGRLDRVKIHKLERISDNLIFVSMTVDYADAEGRKRSFSMRDRWVLVDNEWFHLIKDPLLFPGI